MLTDQRQFKHRELTQKIIGVFYEVYNELGHGFLESVYENSVTLALRKAGFDARHQAPITVRFREQIVGDFRCNSNFLHRAQRGGYLGRSQVLNLPLTLYRRSSIFLMSNV